MDRDLELRDIGVLDCLAFLTVFIVYGKNRIRSY